MTPDRERKAAERQRKTAAGLVRLELWAHPEHCEAIKEYAAQLPPVLGKVKPRAKAKTAVPKVHGQVMASAMCTVCGNLQTILQPVKHPPKCKHCRKPMWQAYR